MNFQKALLFCWLAVSLAGCAARKPTLGYPSFIQSAEIPDSFLAELPDTRAKILSTDVSTRSYSMLLQLPPDYNFSTGGAPDKSLELYVLKGSVTIGEFKLDEGGYAYLPGGTLGASMRSPSGALLLYFIDDVSSDALIQTPIIGDADLLKWQPLSDSAEDFGLATKELRSDPGSGAKTWLWKVDPGAVQDWHSLSAKHEGYLVTGQYHHVECAEGVPVPGDYTPGGYFQRPATIVSGGPESAASTTTIWLMRVQEHASVQRGQQCLPIADE